MITRTHLPGSHTYSLLFIMAFLRPSELQNPDLNCPKQYSVVYGNRYTMCFHIIKRKVTWWNARKECQRLKGDLVWIYSIREHGMFNLFVQLNRRQFPSTRSNDQSKYIWLGIHRKNCERIVWTGPNPNNTNRGIGFIDNQNKNGIFFVTDGVGYRYHAANSGSEKRKAICRYNSAL